MLNLTSFFFTAKRSQKEGKCAIEFPDFHLWHILILILIVNICKIKRKLFVSCLFQAAAKVSAHSYHSPIDHLGATQHIWKEHKFYAKSKVTSMNEMMLKPRQRPKIPPREERNSTGPILMPLSSSAENLYLTSNRSLMKITHDSLLAKEDV